MRSLAWGGIVLGLASYFAIPQPAGGFIGVSILLVSVLIAPRAGLLAAYATLPLYLHTRTFGPLALSCAEVLLLLTALSLAPRSFRRRSMRLSTILGDPPQLSRTPFDWPIALFLSSAILSLLVSDYFRLSLRELRTLVLEPVLAYYLLVVLFKGRAVLWPVGAFLLGAVAVAASGLIGLPLGLGTSEAEGVRRLQSTYPSANHLGLLLGRALPWLLALSWASASWRIPAGVSTVVVGAALMATFSRGAWLGSGAAALAVAWGVGGRRSLALGAMIVVVAVAALFVLPLQRASANLLIGGTGFFRLQLWQSAAWMIRDHPLLGVGLDNFLYLYQQRYILPGGLAEPNLSHPHNLVLQFWLQLGLPGLVAIGWLLGRAVLLARTAWLRIDDRLGRAMVVGALASLLDFVVHGMIDNSYFLPDLAAIFWLNLAVLASLAAAKRDEYSGPPAGSHPRPVTQVRSAPH